MRWSLPVARVAGIPIRVHATFLLLLAWFAWLGWEADGLVSSLWALALIVSLFVCIVLHELAHSLVAIRFGAEVRGVTLLPIGGVASMKSIPEKPTHELLVAVAGPLVNILIAAVLVAVRGGFPSWADAADFPTSGTALVDALIRANIVLVAFNLVPAFPMDGGRVLRSLLALVLPYEQATSLASTVGQVLAVGLIVLGLTSSPLLVIIGLFVFLGADSEGRAVRVKHLLRDVSVGDVMVTGFRALSPEDTIARCLEHVYHNRQEDFPVLVDGRLVGVLPRKTWLSALHAGGPEQKVGAIMLKHFVSISPSLSLARLCQDLWSLPQGVFPVVSGGAVVGLLTADDVSRCLMVQEARARVRPGGPDTEERLTPRSGFSIDVG